MIEAYAVGVELVVDSNAVTAVAGFREQFAAIDAIVTKTQATVKELTTGLAGLETVGKSAAAAWKATADAMERAVRAAQSGAAGGIAMPGGGGGGGAMPNNPNFILSGSPYGPVGGAGMPVGSPYFGAMAPYQGFTTSGGAYTRQGGAMTTGGLGAEPNPINLGWGAEGGAAAGGKGPMSRDAKLAIMWAGFMAGGAADNAVKTEFDLANTLKTLELQGFSKTETDQAYDASVKTQQGSPGTSIPGNLELIGKLMAILQRPGDAIATMPEFAQLGVVLSAFKKGDEGAGLFAAMRAGEFRGVLTTRDASGKDVISPEHLAHFVQEIIATTEASHGTIGPAEIYKFLKAGGVSAAMIDDPSLFASSMATQLAMGSQRAGTALQGFGMQFSAGKMSQAALELLGEMGVIIDPEKARKVGVGQALLLPGAMAPAAQQQVRDNPMDYIMQQILPRMKEYLQKNYGDAYAGADEGHKAQMEYALAQTISSRIPGGTEMVETIRNWLLIERDREAWQKRLTEAPGSYDKLTAGNPLIASKSLDAAAGGFSIAMLRLSEPGVTAGMNVATGFLNALANAANWVKKNPYGTPEGEKFEESHHGVRPGSELGSWLMSLFGGDKPMPVRVVNPGDLAGHVADHIASGIENPSAAPTGVDSRATMPMTWPGP